MTSLGGSNRAREPLYKVNGWKRWTELLTNQRYVGCSTCRIGTRLVAYISVIRVHRKSSVKKMKTLKILAQRIEKTSYRTSSFLVIRTPVIISRYISIKFWCLFIHMFLWDSVNRNMTRRLFERIHEHNSPWLISEQLSHLMVQWFYMYYELTTAWVWHKLFGPYVRPDVNSLGWQNVTPWAQRKLPLSVFTIPHYAFKNNLR